MIPNITFLLLMALLCLIHVICSALVFLDARKRSPKPLLWLLIAFLYPLGGALVYGIIRKSEGQAASTQPTL